MRVIPKTAVRVFDEAVRREPNSPVALLDLAGALTEAGDAQRGAAVLNRGVKAAPDDPLLWYQLGLATNGVEALEKAVTLDASLADAWALLGSLRAETGDFDQRAHRLAQCAAR